MLSEIAIAEVGDDDGESELGEAAESMVIEGIGCWLDGG